MRSDLLVVIFIQVVLSEAREERKAAVAAVAAVLQTAGRR